MEHSVLGPELNALHAELHLNHELAGVVVRATDLGAHLCSLDKLLHPSWLFLHP